MFVENVTYSAALAAGLLSFMSPCVLPLIPAYFTFITGLSLDELTDGGGNSTRVKVILSTLSFVLGFSVVFILMGAAASTAGQVAAKYSDYIRIIGGLFVIVFGAHLIGILKIPGLEMEKRFHFQTKPIHVFGTFLVGMAFGAGWSPCIGPLLGAILAIAVQEGTVKHGVVLLSVYSAGLALPFILMSLFINYMIVFIKKASKAVRYVNITSGVLLILMGLILLVDKMNIITGA